MESSGLSRIIVRVVILILLGVAISLIKAGITARAERQMEINQNWVRAHNLLYWGCQKQPLPEFIGMPVRCGWYHDRNRSLTRQAGTAEFFLAPVEKIVRPRGGGSAWGYEYGNTGFPWLRGREVEGGYDLLLNDTRGTGYLAPLEGRENTYLGQIEPNGEAARDFCLSLDRNFCYYLLRFGEEAVE